MSFGPNEISFVVFIIDPNKFFQLLLCLIKFSGVSCFSRRLGAPGCIGNSKFNPARFCRREASLVDLAIDLIRACV